ncbi:AgrD family cyclic lactone autoinducer peptide [uncultured Robinsoniella sp.]|uniref:AgrD family cyclic lactone autoinducer peptide n=1 Tax=uncultured Robinsoniella sp. TaxID=904190 RepID=UPI00374E4F47
MKSTIKKNLLKVVAAAGHAVALEGGDWPSWYGIYQPSKPEALKKSNGKSTK